MVSIELSGHSQIWAQSHNGNWQGGFDCLDDTEDGLREILEELFENVEVEANHSVAYFIATGPR